MARSIGTYRLVRLAAIGAALATVALVGGCSAGQEAATSQIVTAVPGGFATATPDPSVPLGIVLIENAEIVYKAPAGYPAGGTAPLSMRIFNQTKYEVTVTPGDVNTIDSNGNPGSSAGKLSWISTAPVPTPPPAPAPSLTPSPSGSVSPSTSGSPSGAPASPTEAPTPTVAPIAPIKIPANGFAILTPAQEQYLAITALGAPLMPGTNVALSLTFTTSNGKSTTQSVYATFAAPSSPAPRASLAPSA